MNYNHIAPQGTFIHEYMQYMSEQETAVAYDFWCALWMLGCACGRDVVVARPRAPVYLNVYAILVAESGVTRKSSAIRSALEIINKFNEQHNAFAIVASKSTPEHIERVLHERTEDVGSGRIVVAISELATFLGIEKYAIPMPALLTDLYDCPAVRGGGGTISRGARTARNIWVSFLSASTPTWLYRSVNPNITAGGFSSRCLFILDEKPKRRIAWPTFQDAQSSGVDIPCQLVSRLTEIHTQARLNREITINDGGLKAFSNWYQRRSLHYDDFRASFESREDAHVLRCAALLCINDDTWVIQKGHITNAIRIIAHCKDTASALFEGNNTRSKWVQGVVAVRDHLLAAGTATVSRSRLYLSCRKRLDNAEFIALLDVLHESGAVQRFELKTASKGRPTELYRGTTLLTKKNFVEQITEQMER